jgi:D-alanyl-D-alanine carboxypeptidase
MRRVIATAVLAVVVAGCGPRSEVSIATTATPASASPPVSTLAPAPSSTTVAPAVDFQALVGDFANRIGAGLDGGGIVVAIAGEGDLSVAAAGTQPDGTPVPADGAWRIGSVTKPFVATLVLQLVDEGLVDLDAPVTTYLATPEIPESVTVRDVLGHTSGIFNITEDVGFLPEAIADPERSWEPGELVDRALALRVVPADPGWAYSNTNYLVAGLLVEAVTGEPVHEVLRTRISEPLGLDATYLASDEDGPAPIDSSMSWAGTEVAIDEAFPYTSIATGAWTAGALVSDASDLTTFVRALFRGELITDTSLAAMTTVGTEDYGLGISRFTGLSPEVWGHGGLIPGYLTSVAYSPERDIAVVLGITSSEPPPGLERRFNELLLAALTN